MFDLSECSEPIVQAPMAGGPSTPELASAVCEAGGLGFLAAGYKTADTVREEIDAVRARTARPFGVNLFVPSGQPADPATMQQYLQELGPEAHRAGVELGEPRYDDDDWDRKLQLVYDLRLALVSFTFGCPSAEVVDHLHQVGTAVWVTVTNAEEAVQAQGVGADALVVQGTEAGGHRAAFTDDENAGGSGLLALLRVVSHAVSLPLIATGGIPDGAGVAAVLCAGARAAQIGTALMLVPEAATAPAQRARLKEATPTRLTRAFTGRLARGIVNRFLSEHSANAPVAYPEINHATTGLRAAARRRGDADSFNLWAGQAHQLAEELPAGQVVRKMGADARRVVREVSLLLDESS